MVNQGQPCIGAEAVHHGEAAPLSSEAQEGVVGAQGPLRHFVFEVKVADKGDHLVGHAVCPLDADAPHVEVDADALAALFGPRAQAAAHLNEVPLRVTEHTV